MTATARSSHIHTQRRVNQQQIPLETQRQTDEDEQSERITAGIDKINGYFFENINIERMKQRAAELGLRCVPERIGSKKTHALKISAPSGEYIHLKLGRQDATHANKLISNPESFGLFNRYMGFLISLFGRNEVEHLKLDRLDLRVDHDIDFHQIKRWVRVRGKQANRADTDRSGIRTGITFGKKPSLVCFYDKRAELLRRGEELSHPRTRIEVRLYRNMLPIIYVRELPELLGRDSDGNPFRPFKNVLVEPIHLTPIQNFSTPPLTTNKSVQRLIQRVRLETCLDVAGYDTAYREMNRHGNFRRDILNLATFEEYPHDLDALMIAELERFFQRQSWRPRHDL